MQNSNVKRVTAWAAMLAVVFVILFSYIYISKHAEHDCTGHDCPICAVISWCENNLQTIAAVIAVCAGLFIFILGTKPVLLPCSAFISASLVSQKVRMNN